MRRERRTTLLLPLLMWPVLAAGHAPAVAQDDAKDAAFEKDTGIADAMKAPPGKPAPLRPDPNVEGKSYRAEKCLGDACDVEFQFRKARVGDFTANLKGTAAANYKGAYSNIAMSVTRCEVCDEYKIVQITCDFTRKAGKKQIIEPMGVRRKVRAGWRDPASPSRGCYIDGPELLDPAFEPDPPGAVDPAEEEERREIKEREAARIDNPYLEDPSESGTPTKPARLRDAPGYVESTTEITRNKGSEFYTCLVCTKAGKKGRVLACVHWGFYVDGKGKVASDPATPAASCGPRQELKDAAARWPGRPLDVEF